MEVFPDVTNRQQGLEPWLLKQLSQDQRDKIGKLMKYLDIICGLALLLVAGVSNAADYRAGWTAENFFLTTTECKKAIVLPSAIDFVKRGQAQHHEEESLRNEVISMVPTFEAIATKACYCAVSEFAKDRPYASASLMEMQAYMQTPRCKAERGAAMVTFKKDPKALQLR